MDDYDYLEAQLEGGVKVSAPAEQALPLPPPPPIPTEANGGHRSSRRDEEGRSRRDEEGRSRDKKSKRASRSRSRDRREKDKHRERHSSRDRHREMDIPPPKPTRDREDRSMQREPPRREREWERPSTPPEVRLQREKEQELKDLERTVRTIMIMNLSLKAEEQDIFSFFAAVGAINDIKLIRDKNTRRSKGIAYIEYATVEAAIGALNLNGQVFMNMAVMVKPSEAEKNLAWEAQQQAKLNQTSALNLLNKMGGPGASKLNPIKVQILNLHPDVSEEDLKELFLPFGEINYVRVVRDAANLSTGEAYVQYADEPMAMASIRHYNGFEIAGRKLTVQVSPVYGAQPMVDQMQATAAAMGLSMYPGMNASYQAQMLPPPPMLPGSLDAMMATAGGGEVDDLDEGENKSFKLNAQSRAALMSRLASSAGMQAPPSFLHTTGAPPPAPTAAPSGPALNVSQQVLMDQGLLGPACPIPTPCLLLKNMFTDADKAEANWQVEMEEDVRGEASKFGEILHCHVEPNSKGHVYIKFTTQQGAEAATRTFHGRYYSGNQIVVSFQFLQPYNALFHLAR